MQVQRRARESFCLDVSLLYFQRLALELCFIDWAKRPYIITTGCRRNSPHARVDSNKSGVTLRLKNSRECGQTRSGRSTKGALSPLADKNYKSLSIHHRSAAAALRRVISNLTLISRSRSRSRSSNRQAMLDSSRPRKINILERSRRRRSSKRIRAIRRYEIT